LSGKLRDALVATKLGLTFRTIEVLAPIRLARQEKLRQQGVVFFHRYLGLADTFGELPRLRFSSQHRTCFRPARPRVVISSKSSVGAARASRRSTALRLTLALNSLVATVTSSATSRASAVKNSTDATSSFRRVACFARTTSKPAWSEIEIRCAILTSSALIAASSA